jgi:hypothetical protein
VGPSKPCLPDWENDRTESGAALAEIAEILKNVHETSGVMESAICPRFVVDNAGTGRHEVCFG